MSSSEPLDLVRATWGAFGRADVKAAFADLTDDVTWAIPEPSPRCPGRSGANESIFAFLEAVAKTFPAGLRSETTAAHVAGDTVVVEMTNRGTTAAGRPYENQYCFVFEVKDAKIRAIREYVDTQKAAEVLGA